MSLNMNPVFVLILVVCGTHARIELLIDDSLFEDSSEYESTTPASVSTVASGCTVGGMAGACVQSRVYCKTPNTGPEPITLRPRNTCQAGVCCKLSDVISTSASIASTPSTSTRGTSTSARTTSTSARTTSTSARIPSTSTSVTTPTSSIITRLGPTASDTAVKEGCGWRNPQGVGSQTTTLPEGEANFGEFPWMVMIFRTIPVDKDDPSGEQLNVFSGGGSLIHMKVVLTTAHYVANAENLTTRAGEWDSQSTDETYPFQDRDVVKREIHKDFIRGTLYYDAALLFLNKAFDAAPHIGVACLPPPKHLQQEGTMCLTTGWGKDKFGKAGQFQGVLKKIELPVVKHSTCKSLLRKTRLGSIFELHRSFMCAGGEAGKDTCKGDGGSPLVCPMEYETDRYVQAGMASWGIGCGSDGTPGVYVDISVVRGWIDNKMAGNGLGDEMVYARY